MSQQAWQTADPAAHAGVYANGLQGAATVNAISETGIKMNDAPVCELDLTVVVPGREPYLVKHRQLFAIAVLPRYQPGATFSVRVDGTTRRSSSSAEEGPVSLLGRIGLVSVPDAVVLDAASLDCVAELDVGGSRGDVAAAGDAVWFTTRNARSLSRIDPVSRSETRRLELPERPLAVAADRLGAVVLCEGDLVVRARPDGSALDAGERLPEGVIDVVADGGAVWALRVTGDMPFDVSLLSLDPISLLLRCEVPLCGRALPPACARATAWCARSWRIRPGRCATRSSTSPPASSFRRSAATARGIAERDGMRWIQDGDRRFKRIDIASGRTLAEGDAPGPEVGSVVLAHGCLWACNFRRQRGEPQHMQ